jgi:hypothetical protein
VTPIQRWSDTMFPTVIRRLSQKEFFEKAELSEPKQNKVKRGKGRNESQGPI